MPAGGARTTARPLSPPTPGTISRFAAGLSAGPQNVPAEPAIECAHRILAAKVRKALAEAHARARVAHGLLPQHDESHREVASELAEEVLRHHSGGEIDDQSLQDLLVDLIHCAGAASSPARPSW